MAKRQLKSVSVKLPIDIYQAIRSEAKSEHHTITTHLVLIIDAHFERQDKDSVERSQIGAKR